MENKLSKAPQQKPNTTTKQGELTPREIDQPKTSKNADQEDTTCGSIAASIYAFFQTIIYKVSGDAPDMKFHI